MSSISINKKTLTWMYESGYTINEMVDYLNGNYSTQNSKFNSKNVKELYIRIGLDLRKKPRKGIQINIVEDEFDEEYVNEEPMEDIPENLI